ncbi:MAG: chorismate synthase, partial [Thaumarchaeota archaeon]|nr:chorismate synthase [Nitrososphaerota archaeon]
DLPVGLGEPVFASIDSDLSKALFAVPAVKGVEFGLGFESARRYGSENNDVFKVVDGKIVTETNNSGGILGGITSGMPLVIKIAFKPPSSIAKSQATVSMKTLEQTSLVVTGRHDPCVLPRAPPIVESIVATVLADHGLRAGLIPQMLKPSKPSE